MSGQITIHWDVVKGLEKKAYRALALTAQTLQDEMREEAVIPRDTGALQGEKFFVDDKNAEQGEVYLVFEGPYANRLYHHPEYNFRKDKNPNAQGMWMRHWQNGGVYEKRPQEIFEGIMKKEL